MRLLPAILLVTLAACTAAMASPNGGSRQDSARTLSPYPSMASLSRTDAQNYGGPGDPPNQHDIDSAHIYYFALNLAFPNGSGAKKRKISSLFKSRQKAGSGPIISKEIKTFHGHIKTMLKDWVADRPTESVKKLGDDVVKLVEDIESDIRSTPSHSLRNCILAYYDDIITGIPKTQTHNKVKKSCDFYAGIISPVMEVALLSLKDCCKRV